MTGLSLQESFRLALRLTAPGRLPNLVARGRVTAPVAQLSDI